MMIVTERCSVVIYSSIQDTFRNLIEHPILKALISTLGAIIVQLQGPWTIFHWVALTMLIMDSLVGIYKARFVDNNYSPTVLGKRTTIKLIIYAMLFILIRQIALVLDGNIQIIFYQGTALYIILVEWESIVRNMRAMGHSLPSITALYRIGSLFNKNRK